MKKQKNLSVKKQFDEAKKYLWESTNYIYLTMGLFIFFSIVGFIFQDQLAPMINELLKDIIDQTIGLNTPEMIFFILQNNLLSAFLAIIIGSIIGIFPIISSLVNGVVIGYVLALSSEVAGFQSWWRLLPHGIFELPAIFISFGLGIKLGFAWFSNKKDKVKELQRRFYQSMNVFLMIIIPLLIIAAIIEGILIAFIS